MENKKQYNPFTVSKYNGKYTISVISKFVNTKDGKLDQSKTYFVNIGKASDNINTVKAELIDMIRNAVEYKK